MNKVVIVILGGFTIALIIMVLLTQRSKTPILPVPKSQPSPTKTVTLSPQLKIYTNSSGFSFEYPKSLLLTEKKITDQSIYAWVELTDPQKKGVISIKLEGSDLTKIDNRVGVGKIKKVKLADLEAREFTEKNRTTTVALDQGGVLITITTDSLLPAYQQIISSFIFIQPTQASPATSEDGSGDIVFEGEEVIE